MTLEVAWLFIPLELFSVLQPPFSFNQQKLSRTSLEEMGLLMQVISWESLELSSSGCTGLLSMELLELMDKSNRGQSLIPTYR